MNKKIESITIVGVGSIGGYLSKYISLLDSVKYLYLMDSDIVEDKNIKNSIYKSYDIGLKKVDALWKKMDVIKRIKHKKGKKFSVLNISRNFDENFDKRKKWPDLIIDCRDSNTSRNNSIDVKIYISHKNLIIDCRKTVKEVSNFNGYVDKSIRNRDIKMAAYLVYYLLKNSYLNLLIFRQIVYSINLYKGFDINDFLFNIKLKDEQKDYVYEDVSKHEDKLYGYYPIIEPVLKINKNHKIPICLNYPDPDKFLLSEIEVSSCKDIRDVIKELILCVENSSKDDKFLVGLNMKGKPCIILFQETGGA